MLLHTSILFLLLLRHVSSNLGKVDYNHKPLKGENELDTEAISLWAEPNGQPNVLHLDGSNFKETILTPANKTTNFLVIFYSHTCPHCRGRAPEFREFAKSVANLKEKIQIAVYNCNRPFNALYCRQVKNYPTIMFFTKESSTIKDGRKLPEFAHAPVHQMLNDFTNLLSAQFDMSSSEEILLELDANTYNLTIDNGTANKTVFFVLFSNGAPSAFWLHLANLCARWKEIVRIAFVNCKLDQNKQNPCFTIPNHQVQPYPFIYFIYQRMEQSPDGNLVPMPKDYVQMPYMENVANLRLFLVYKLFEVNYFGVLKKSLANNDFVQLSVPQSYAKLAPTPFSYTSKTTVQYPPQQQAHFANGYGQMGQSTAYGYYGFGQQPQPVRVKRRAGIGGLVNAILGNKQHGNVYNTNNYGPRPTYADANTLMKQMLPTIWPSITIFMQIYILLVFEYPNVGNNGIADFASRLIISLNHWKRFIHIVPIQKPHPLAGSSNTQFWQYPELKLFKFGHSMPILSKTYGIEEGSDLIALRDIIAATGLMEDDSKFYDHFEPIECDKLYARCVPLYFASETDILKALREAIFDEVVTKVEIIEEDAHRNLYNFLAALELYLPNYSIHGPNQWQKLTRTQNAKSIFGHLKILLQNYPKVHVSIWESQLKALEHHYGNPFPKDGEEWRHCLSTDQQNPRRFTCGIWTAFHVLTVNAYKTNAHPIGVLKAIQGWVMSFFGCEDCRSHFVEMTTEAMPIEQHAKRAEDVVLYLWRAHNRVNDRLEKEERYVWSKTAQSDRIFRKQQFPPKFLCPKCEQQNERQILDFLLYYYGRIEPANQHLYFHSWERKLAYGKSWIYELMEGNF